MNFATTVEGFTVPERPRATRVSGRPALYTGGIPELTHLPFVPGNKGPEVQNTSLELGSDLASRAADLLAGNADMIGAGARSTANGIIEYRDILVTDGILLGSWKIITGLIRKIRRSFDNSGY